MNEKIEEAFNKFKEEYSNKGFAYSGTGVEIFRAGHEAAMREKGDMFKAALAYQKLSLCYRTGKQPSEKLFKELEKAAKLLEECENARQGGLSCE